MSVMMMKKSDLLISKTKTFEPEKARFERVAIGAVYGIVTGEMERRR